MPMQKSINTKGQTETKHFSVTRVVEILDMSTLTWRRGMDLKEVVTGTSLILVKGRPALVGRYGKENQRRILRYKEDSEYCVCCVFCANILHHATKFLHRFVGKCCGSAVGGPQ